jgi:endogenous inhibitor of DNA gyrase (YacG/DUF329 family)
MSNPQPHRAKCPICGKATAAAYRPFCSRRCADVDLARWLSGNYVISDPVSDPASGPHSGPADAHTAGNTAAADASADAEDGEGP